MTKRHLKFVPALLAASVLTLSSCDKDNLKPDTTAPLTGDQQSQSQDQHQGSAIPGQYIVVYKSESGSDASAKQYKLPAFMRNKQIIRELKGAISGHVTVLNQEELNELRNSEGVVRVEPDYRMQLEQTTTTTTTTTSTQTTPWNINRVGYSNCLGKTAWIIDSGIQLNHPDLTVDAGRSRSFLTTTTSPNDENGHGTMCAGIIAAKNNTVGIRGVASGATVVALRVFDATGSGSSSAVISALNHVYTYGRAGDVVNMSLGGPASTTLDDVVRKVAAKGILIAIAAGNSAVNVANVSPARVNAVGVYTVSAMSQGDYWASFSNYGSPTVDFCAPGQNIKSTTKGSTYATGAGTSFAAPHIAGLLLLKGNAINTSGYVRNDPDGVADKIGHF